MSTRIETIKQVRLAHFVTIAMLWTGQAVAHHGWSSHYDRDVYVSLTGVVTDYQFVNPHAFVYLDTVNEAGEIEARWCEMQSRVQLERRGVSAEHFAVGTSITIEGFVSRSDPMGCELAIAHFQDGTDLALRHRDGEAVFGAPIIEGDTSIVGTWYPDAYLVDAGSAADSQGLLTREGEAVHAAFDWEMQNPTLRCNPASNIRAWGAPGLPSSISRQGDEIHIRHEFMDVHRVIQFDGTGYSDPAPTDLGYSIARFEDDALYIETTGYRAGALWAGRLNTADLSTTEKLWVEPETGLLHLAWTANDAAYYTGIQRGTRTFVRTDLQVGRFDCVPELGHAPTN
ncbi:MAG: DUF6152 family protein [Arenicellaceae bacterium]|nr:DUF6152 family protein [Arenicellaceae bacterium]